MAHFISFLFFPALFAVGGILFRWRWGVIFVFVWLFVGDSVRKLVPGQPPELLLVGDALLLITYISFFAHRIVRKEKIWTPPFLGALMVFALIVIIEIFNPVSPSFAVGLIGIRSYLWFVPLLFLGFSFFESKEKFLKFCRILVMLAIPLLLFAVLQGVLGDTASPFFKPFETTHQKHSFGIGFRAGFVDKISSFFGTDQRYGMVVLFLFLLGLALSAAPKVSGVSKRWVYLGTFSAFVGATISGSRSAFALAVIGFLLFAIIVKRAVLKKKTIVVWKFLETKVIFILFILLLLALLGIYIFISDVGLSQIYAIFNIFSGLIPSFIKEMQFVIPNAPIFGYGTGAFAQGLQEVGQFEGTLGRLIHLGGETGIKRLLFELGIAGFIVFYVFWGRIFLCIRRFLGRVSDFDMKYIGISVALFAFLMLLRFTFVHHQVLGDYAVLILLWFFLGALFRLKEMK